MNATGHAHAREPIENHCQGVVGEAHAGEGVVPAKSIHSDRACNNVTSRSLAIAGILAEALKTWVDCADARALRRTLLTLAAVLDD